MSAFDPKRTFVLLSARYAIVRRTSAVDFAVEIEFVIARQVVGHVEPSDSVFIPNVVGRYESVGVVECTDVELEDHSAFGEIAFPFPGERRSALAAEGTSYARRRIVYLTLPLRECDLILFEACKRNHRGPAVPPTALTMAVTNPKRLTAYLVPHSPAHAAALENLVFVHRCLPRYVLVIGCSLWTEIPQMTTCGHR